MSNLNITSSRVSLTLIDEKVSNEEFHLVLDEVKKYPQMKDKIRSKPPLDPVLDLETNEGLIC